jgi:hypothetical protein
MSRFDLRIMWGMLLIVAGLLFLAQSLGLIPSAWGALWAVVFGVAGLAFVAWLFVDRRQWWAIIPGLTLLGLAGVIVLSMLTPEENGGWAGAVFLGAIGLSFVIVYIMRRDFWWALIPAGALLTLALVALSTSFMTGLESGALLFIGLGVTFGIVALVPTPDGRMTWALIPAVILGVMGILIALALGSLLNYVWPIALIIVGVYILIRGFALGKS